MTSYIGGLASGLDTASMIKQLMEVERLPILNLQSNRQKLVAKDDAWRDIATRLSSLRTSLDALAHLLPDGRAGEYLERLMVYGRTGEPCLACGTPIERVVVAQRSSPFCPNCQR